MISKSLMIIFKHSRVHTFDCGSATHVTTQLRNEQLQLCFAHGAKKINTQARQLLATYSTKNKLIRDHRAELHGSDYHPILFI